MGSSFDAGMVLVLSIWDDHAVNMLWLDSDYPTDADASAPGVSRGPCAVTSGVPTGEFFLHFHLSVREGANSVLQTSNLRALALLSSSLPSSTVTLEPHTLCK